MLFGKQCVRAENSLKQCCVGNTVFLPLTAYHRVTVVSLDNPALQELLDPLDLPELLVHLASLEIVERL